jgi:hypothetical protein
MFKKSDSTLDLNQLRNVEMFKMSQFKPVSGKKLRVNVEIPINFEDFQDKTFIMK